MPSNLDAPFSQSFAPVADADTRVLILGSLPGRASLAAGQYYAHPQNQFWRLLGAVLQEPLPELEYAQKLERLLARRIGLWDVVAQARRRGSLDSNLRDVGGNDLAGLLRPLPALRLIAFNGAAAAKIGRAQLGGRADAYEILLLPSSSPAHASKSLNDKLLVWRMISQAL